MISDSHVHSVWSEDSDTPARQQIEKAISLGMRHITFTDHHDEDFPSRDYHFILDFQGHERDIMALREEYRGRIDVGYGIELGLQTHLTGRLEELIAPYPYDFIIGSTHASRKIDPWERELFFAGIDEADAYRIYLEEELENLKAFRCWDVAGHLDFAMRYGPNREKIYTWERYGELLEAILQVILAGGKGLEYNTAGLRAGLPYAHPRPEVWKRYRELGGEIVTIGSDAHEPEHLGYRFDYARDFLLAAGFRYYAVYRDRRPEFYPL